MFNKYQVNWNISLRFGFSIGYTNIEIRIFSITPETSVSIMSRRTSVPFSVLFENVPVVINRKGGSVSTGG